MPPIRLQVLPLLLCAAALLGAASGHADDFVEQPRIARLFDAAGVTGTFVALDPAGQLTGHDAERARQQMVPASTYKIPHTLIGLSSGAVGSVDEVLPYGGAPQPFPQWERDMSLREALPGSVVPIYQTLARRIGLDRMQQGVDALAYGNRQLGSVVDRFWLDGPLRISAVEQVRFLARLARTELPPAAAAQAATRDIMRLERQGHRTLYGKTGWQNAPDPGVGWWVGWVDDGKQIYAFALNLDIRSEADAARRVALGKAALAALRLWPEPTVP